MKTDDAGLITAFGAWPVLCGPPPPQNAAKDGKLIFGTLKPVDGMVMDKDGTTAAPTRSRLCAPPPRPARSRESDDITNLHWVREGISRARAPTPWRISLSGSPLWTRRRPRCDFRRARLHAM